MLQILARVVIYHRASIFHWDFKPSNLLVVVDGSLRIVDFGQTKKIMSKDETNWPSFDIGE